MAASATLALKAGVWFRRGRRCMVSPDSRATACPPSGRNSTYRPVQISGASSDTPPTSERENAMPTPKLSMLRLAACIFLTAVAAAFAQDVPEMAAGEAAWDKAGCLQCHGESGEGGAGGEFPAGP